MDFKAYLASETKARAALVKRNASILALENTGERFRTIKAENANLRVFTIIDQEFEVNMQLLKDDNRAFTSWVLHASVNLKEDPDFKSDQENYNTVSLEVVKCREEAYQVLDSKGLFPQVEPEVSKSIDLATVLQQLAADAQKDRDAHALALTNVSKLAADAANAQTAALKKLKPAGIKLSCSKFDGGKDRHQYSQWYSQFIAMIEASGVEDNRVKLSQLITHLAPGGLALKLVSDLEIKDANYAPAIAALEKEFLDKAKNKKELLQQVLNKAPSYDTTFESTRVYLSELKSILLNLQKHYQVNLLDAAQSGFHLVGVNVFNKLPTLVQRNLIIKLNTNYPTLQQILDETSGVITTLVLTKPKFHKNSNSSESNTTPFNKSSLNTHKSSANTLTNFHTNSNYKINKCYLCDTIGHYAMNCFSYVDFEDRVAKLKANNRCIKCTSTQHADCKEVYKPCVICGSKDHVAVVCKQHIASLGAKVQAYKAKRTAKTAHTDVCYMNGVEGSLHLLPVINLKLKDHYGQSKYFNFLFDTGSERSYLSQKAISTLSIKPELVNTVAYEVKTFVGSGYKTLKEINLGVYYSHNNHISTQMLIDDKFDLSVRAQYLHQALANIKDAGYKLLAEFDQGDTISVQGLIGNDIIELLQPLRIIKCLNGSAWELSSGVMPFGRITNFLYPDQIASIVPSNHVDNFNTVIANNVCPATHVNFCMNPKASYEDVFDHFFDESMVERRLDKMFSVESLGISDEDESLSNYDQLKVKEFEDAAEFKDGTWHVKLLWHDNVDQVQSGHQVALAVCDRVDKKLKAIGRNDEYINNNKKLLEEGIVETFECNPKDFHKYIWIPHRPVFKDEEQATTKMRQVFNCSFKAKKSCPSLNEASYAGINLMGDMLALLLHFRTNKYVYLADIKQAFLRIKLKNLEDKNRFCFFMREGDKIVCYRFNTILFGFNASPFVLNFIIKKHASLFPDDSCTDMLYQNFFVDNLVKTSDSISDLTYLYKESVERMAIGNFNLRSCNTNDEQLRNTMIQDGRYVDHGSNQEKVLGYRYNPVTDSMQLAQAQIVEDVDTKRGILSQTSKIFDPLSFAAPVTVRCKTLISLLWEEKTSDEHWDVKVSLKAQEIWNSLCKDLIKLDSLEFGRFSLSETKNTNLYLFCDASKLGAYGYVAYGVQEAQSNFLFAKCKGIPHKKKSLPTLELLSVYLAIKGLYSLLKAYSKFKILNIFIAVDAQVVISWLLSSNVKTSNMFARNRIKDIHTMLKELKEKYKIPICFKYVPTDQNPGDLLTRGLSFDVFQRNLEFWLHGPSWIQRDVASWPSHELGCLSAHSKSIVTNACLENVNKSIEPVVPFDRYNKLSQLLNTTARVIKTISNLKYFDNDKLLSKWGTTDINLCAKIHLISIMQQQRFDKEISFLLDSNNKQIPELVINKNLYIDKYCILRSAGRHDKCDAYDRDITNPILLAKDHDLTKLIIEDCHRKCQHLGIDATVNMIRLSGFEIPKARQAVKNVIKFCTICKRYNVLSFRYPKLTNLPKHRVNFIRPYLHTGIDYTSHFMIREGTNYRKMYILVFTCMNIRAIHIELVSDLSTRSLVLALLRFINIYGVPSHIYSDNGKSLIAGVDLMQEMFTSSEYREKLLKHNIKHIRIPTYSPWVGSCWERMIRTMKLCIYKVIGRVRLSYFDLLTVLSSVQNAINARPLTYRCSDNSGLQEITPNSFLRPYANKMPFFNTEDPNILKCDPPSRRQIKIFLNDRDALLEEFRKEWYDSYLLSMRTQYKDLHHVHFKNRVKIGDVVLVKGPSKDTRPYWKLGRVIKLIPGDDGIVRSVSLLKGDPPEEAIHSICHLYPMELSTTHSHVAHNPINDTNQGGVIENAVVEGYHGEDEMARNVLHDQSDHGLDDQLVDHGLDDQRSDHVSNLLNSFDDDMSEEIMPSSLDNSLDNLLDFVYESLGSEFTPIDNGNQVDDIVEPVSEEFDFLGFDAQHTSLDAPSVEVSASSTLGARPKRTLRPSRRPMDDQYDWDWDQV